MKFLKGFSVFAVTLVLGANAFVPEAEAVFGSKTIDNDPYCCASAWSENMSTGSPAFQYTNNVSASYSGDHRMTRTYWADYRYHWVWDGNFTTEQVFSVEVYLNNLSFNNPSAKYYFNGVPYSTLNQDLARPGWNILPRTTAFIAAPKKIDFTVSSQNNYGSYNTGADAIRFYW